MISRSGSGARFGDCRKPPATAWRIGRTTIREAWPLSSWYVLAPGIVSLALARLIPGSEAGKVALTVLCVLLGMVALLFKGAVAAFYLRLHPDVGSSGAAYEERYDSREDWRWDDDWGEWNRR